MCDQCDQPSQWRALTYVDVDCYQGWTDIDFLPDTGLGYPMPKIRPDLDLAGLDFSCNCNTEGP